MGIDGGLPGFVGRKALEQWGNAFGEGCLFGLVKFAHRQPRTPDWVTELLDGRARDEPLEEDTPPQDDRGIEASGLDQQHEIVGWWLGEGSLGLQEILGGPFSGRREHVGVRLDDERTDCLGTLVEFGSELSVSFALAGALQFRRHDRFGGAAKDAVEGIVVGLRDGVVFVIVAASTCNRQSHQPSCDHVNLVVNLVVEVVHETWAECQEPHRGT